MHERESVFSTQSTGRPKLQPTLGTAPIDRFAACLTGWDALPCPRPLGGSKINFDALCACIVQTIDFYLCIVYIETLSLCNGLDGCSSGDFLWRGDMRDIIGGVAVSAAGMVIPVEVSCVVVRPRLSNDRPVVLQQRIDSQLSANLDVHMCQTCEHKQGA